MKGCEKTLSRVRLCVTEVYENGEDENPILNLGELQHCSCSVLRNLQHSVPVFTGIECNMLSKTVLFFLLMVETLFVICTCAAGSDANLFEGDILIPVSCILRFEKDPFAH